MTKVLNIRLNVLGKEDSEVAQSYDSVGSVLRQLAYRLEQEGHELGVQGNCDDARSKFWGSV